MKMGTRYTGYSCNFLMLKAVIVVNDLTKKKKRTKYIDIHRETCGVPVPFATERKSLLASLRKLDKFSGESDRSSVYSIYCKSDSGSISVCVCVCVSVCIAKARLSRLMGTGLNGPDNRESR